MNVFNKVTLQGLRKNRTRTIVTIVGVVLSAALLTAVTTFISSLQHYLVQTVIAEDGDWHVQYTGVDRVFINQLAADDRTEAISVTQDIGYAKLDGSRNESKPYIFVSAFSAEAFETIPLKLLAGRLPQNEGELLISEHIEANGGVSYAIGDTLTLDVGVRVLADETLGQNSSYQSGQEGQAETFTPTGTKSYTIVGVCERPGFESYAAPGFSVITGLGGASAASAGRLNAYVKLDRPSAVYDFTEKYDGAFRYNADLLRFQGVSGSDSFMIVLYSLGAILIVLIMVGSVLLIYNSFSISVSERTRQFGILSSVGATGKQLRKSVIFEGACIGLIGIPLGVLLGIGGIGVTLALLGDIFKEMSASHVPLTLSVSVVSVVTAILVGVSTILISAYLPAKKAAKLSAIEAIRQTSDINISAQKIKTSKLVQQLFGLEGTLAMKNFKRNKKRYRSTVLSLFVSIVLFISVSGFGMYLQQGATNSIAESGFDIAIEMSSLSVDGTVALYDQLKSVSGITDSAYQMSLQDMTPLSPDVFSERSREFLGVGQLDAEDYETGVIINFIDDATFSEYLKELGLAPSDYMEDSSKLLAYSMVNEYDPTTDRYVVFDLFETNKPMSISLAAAESAETGLGKDVTLHFVDSMPATIFSRTNFGINAFAPVSLLPDYPYNMSTLDSRYLTFMSNDPNKSVGEMNTILKDNHITSGYSLYNVAEMEQAHRKTLLVLNVFTYGFIILISLITVANVFNTISTNINLRRREFAMLKSVGMTSRGFNRMMNFECLFYGVKALLYGLPVSFGITYLIYNAVMAGVDVPFSMPWASVGISVVGVFLVVFATMLYSISKVKKENTVEALKTDML